MATWPSTLPDTPMEEGYSESFQDPILRTQMDAGPAKVRRRFTATVRTFTMRMVLSTTQMADLDTFYVTTTNYGADAFDWTHPRTEVATSFRFVGPPKYTARGGLYWTVNFTVEVLP